MVIADMVEVDREDVELLSQFVEATLNPIYPYS
jgi:hypothetical protein